MDYYETLQVHPKADREAITASYERLRGRYEPARLEGAAEELVDLARRRRDDIERAYAILSDPLRRAAYDEEQRAAQPVALEDIPLPDTNEVSARPRGIANGHTEELLDYSPLPPAQRQERAKAFNAQPSLKRRATINARQGGRATQVTSARPAWVVPIGVVSTLVVAIALITFFATNTGRGDTDSRTSAQQAAAGTAQAVLSPSAGTGQPSVDQVVNQYEPMIAAAQQAVKTNAQSADAWVNLGNVLFDSVQIVRENQPGSDVYQQRISRWVDASDAYAKALAITPNNATVRADMAVSLCYYGSDRGDQSYVTRGLAEAEKAVQQNASEPRILFDTGICQMSVQPPQTDNAIKNWQQVVAMKDKDPALATQAQRLLDQQAPK